MKKMIKTNLFHLHDYLFELARVTQRFRACRERGRLLPPRISSLSLTEGFFGSRSSSTTFFVASTFFSLIRLPSKDRRLFTAALILAATVTRLSAGTLIVTNLADSGPGTLREAITSSVHGDIIEIQATGTITLESQLMIANDLTINGPGADQLKISGNNSTRVFHITDSFDTGTFLTGMTICDGRVVGASGVPGMKGEDVFGGGILVDNAGSVWMTECVVSNNTAVGGQGGAQSDSGGISGIGGNAFGGGIANTATIGGVILEKCRVTGNFASGGDSGPVTDGFPGMGGQGWGGGLYSSVSLARVDRCTVDGNFAVAGGGTGAPGGGAGGGIYNEGLLQVWVSTIVSNSAFGGAFDTGGGINNNETLTIEDSTIVDNESDFGGGITGGELRNTILAGNSASSSGPDASGNITSADYNFIQNISGAFITGATNHNIVGQDPLLGPLQENGGATPGIQTPTMAPLPGSPVIDQGDSVYAEDQRGVARPVDTNIPDAQGGNSADIGAVEFNQTTAIVQNNNDSGVGSLRASLAGGIDSIEFSTNVTGTIALTSGELVVNHAVSIEGPGADILAISGNQNGRIFNITAGSMEIVGLTLRDGLVVGAPGTMGSSGTDGADARGGAILNQGEFLNLINCVIVSNRVVGGTGGVATSGTGGDGGRAQGGGVYSEGEYLGMLFCRFAHNECIGGAGGAATSGSAGSGGFALGGAVASADDEMAAGFGNLIENRATGGAGGVTTDGGSPGNGGSAFGGGLYAEHLTRLIANSISGGRATGGTGEGGDAGGFGGAIYSDQELSLITCTIASNSASGAGGGIANANVLNLTNSTIVGNQANVAGGVAGNANMINTILAGNVATESDPEADGLITSYDYNLIQDTNGLELKGTLAHVIIGQDPLLGPLRDNGGARLNNDESGILTLTLSPLPGSPVIDQGISIEPLFGAMVDQRFAEKPVDLPVPNASGGDGADIGAFEVGVPPLRILHSPPNVVLQWSGSYGDVALEATTAIPPATGWSPITNTATPDVEEGYRVTDSAEEGMKFYRLFKP